MSLQSRLWSSECSALSRGSAVQVSSLDIIVRMSAKTPNPGRCQYQSQTQCQYTANIRRRPTSLLSRSHLTMKTSKPAMLCLSTLQGFAYALTLNSLLYIYIYIYANICACVYVCLCGPGGGGGGNGVAALPHVSSVGDSTHRCRCEKDRARLPLKQPVHNNHDRHYTH